MEFNTTHAALFDELERQGVFNVDIAKLTHAVVQATVVIGISPPALPYKRCETCED